MEITNLIAIETFCSSHEIETTLVYEIHEVGLIELVNVKENVFIKEEHLSDLEKMIRLKKDLEINTEGIGAIFQLLNKVNSLQEEIIYLKNRLSIYDSDFEKEV